MTHIPKVDYGKVLALDICLLRMEKKKKRRFLLAIKRLLFRRTYTLPNTNNVFFQSMRRSDYDVLFESISDSFAKEKSIIRMPQNQDKVDFLFLWRVLVTTYYLERKNYKTLLEYVYAIILVAGYSRYKDIVSDKLNMLVVFSDMQPIDNLLVQIANSYNVKTVTMQHGLYVDYDSYDNINKYNYKNCLSKYFLAWGEETKELLEAYTNTYAYICGKPVDLVRHKNFSNYFTIIFDQNLFYEKNVEMLEIGRKIRNEIGIEINVRLHPSNDPSKYEIDVRRLKIGFPIEKSKFVLGHTSSYIYECMRVGLPSFRYRTNVPTNKKGEEIDFKKIEEFLDKYRQIDNIDFVGLSEYYIKYYGEKSKNMYSIALQEICER